MESKSYRVFQSLIPRLHELAPAARGKEAGLRNLGIKLLPSPVNLMGLDDKKRGNTEIRYKAGPRLRDLASWPPLAAGESSRNLGPTL